MNENIRAKSLRVIDSNGDNLGTISKEEALRIAKSQELDLFVVSDKSEIPVARILDYGKFKFELSKKEKTQKKKQNSNEFKEIKLRYNIDIGDYNTRLNQAKKFLDKGKRVKLNITLRGREMQHQNLAQDLARRFLNDLVYEGHPEGDVGKMTGRSMIVFIIPGPDKTKIKEIEKAKKEQEDAENDSESEDS